MACIVKRDYRKDAIHVLEAGLLLEFSALNRFTGTKCFV